MLTWSDVFMTALAISALSVTASKSALFEAPRRWVKGPLGKLFSCPYCLSHWFALAAVAWLPLASLANAFVTLFALVSLSAMITGVTIQLLHQGEHERDALQQRLEKLEEELFLTQTTRDAYRQALKEIAAEEEKT